jgi:hypothetical protein
MEGGIKTSQRVSRSCVECGRRKIKCDKKSPCQPCIRRNAAHECKRPIARVRGQLTVYAETGTEDAEYADDEQVRELLRQRAALQAQVAELETALALSKPCAHNHGRTSTDYSQAPASLEDLVPAFEQFDIGLKNDSVTHGITAKDVADQLYEPITDPISLLLPRRNASHQIVTFSLQTLGWLHCAVDADTFLEAHEEFWQSAQLNINLGREQRPWMSIYFAILAVGILYMDPEVLPSAIELPQPGLPLDQSVNIAVHTSRLWYEAALKEVERFGCSGVPNLPIVQALSVLTLCHSNFGEHQREWLFTGLATNIARCLDMHKLGTEAAVSKELCLKQEWSTPAQRELGRRLWWSYVIRDWSVHQELCVCNVLIEICRLGSWSRPPSISPASFCCNFSTQDKFGSNILATASSWSTASTTETSSLSTPSPAHYHSIMSRLAYIFYVYIKANNHQTLSKLTKAIEEVESVRKDLPLHLSPHFPANDDDRQWESENSWVPFQRYLVSHVLDFLELGIARVLVSKGTETDPTEHRKLAVRLSSSILRNYAIPVPRVYRLVWTVSAAAVAASVYIALDMLANPNEYHRELKMNTIDLLRHAAVELNKHADVAVHAAKGSRMIERLLPLVTQDSIATHFPLRTVHDLVQHLSMTEDASEISCFEESPRTVYDIYGGTFFDETTFGELGDHFQAPVGLDEWEGSLFGL